MGKRILSVCFVNNTYHYQEFERRPGRTLARPPVLASTPEALLAACREAEEIGVAAEIFPCIYETVVLPKVPKKYLKNLVLQDAKEKLNTAESVQVRFNFLREVTEAGIAKWQVSYVGLPGGEVKRFWNLFKPYQQKVRHITTVPVALGAAIRKIAPRDEKFMVIWIKDSIAYITINSPKGVVRMERVVPLRSSLCDFATTPGGLKELLEEIEEEISMTMTFYKHRFRDKVPSILYCLGGPELSSVLSEDTWSNMGFSVISSLSDSSILGLSEKEFNESLVLMGNLQPPEEFNFVPDEAYAFARESFAIKIAYVVMLIFITAGFGLATHLSMKQGETLQALKGKQVALEDVKSQIVALGDEYTQIKAFDGWVAFYDDFCSNPPRWDRMLTQLTNAIPNEVVITEFQIKSERSGKGLLWKGKMKGLVRTTNWQEGLKLLRKYGENLQASAAFDVLVVEYEPKDTERKESKQSDFEYQLELRFVPQEQSDAS